MNPGNSKLEIRIHRDVYSAGGIIMTLIQHVIDAIDSRRLERHHCISYRTIVHENTIMGRLDSENLVVEAELSHRGPKRRDWEIDYSPSESRCESQFVPEVSISQHPHTDSSKTSEATTRNSWGVCTSHRHWQHWVSISFDGCKKVQRVAKAHEAF